MKKIILVAGLLAMGTASAAFADDMDHIKMMVDKHMKMMDTNGDGMISKEEHAAGAEKMFNEADTNHDGMISRDEMIAMKMKEKKDMSMGDGMMEKKVSDGTPEKK